MGDDQREKESHGALVFRLQESETFLVQSSSASSSSDVGANSVGSALIKGHGPELWRFRGLGSHSCDGATAVRVSGTGRARQRGGGSGGWKAHPVPRRRKPWLSRAHECLPLLDFAASRATYALLRPVPRNEERCTDTPTHCLTIAAHRELHKVFRFLDSNFTH